VTLCGERRVCQSVNDQSCSPSKQSGHRIWRSRLLVAARLLLDRASRAKNCDGYHRLEFRTVPNPACCGLGVTFKRRCSKSPASDVVVSDFHRPRLSFYPELRWVSSDSRSEKPEQCDRFPQAIHDAGKGLFDGTNRVFSQTFSTRKCDQTKRCPSRPAQVVLIGVCDDQ